MKDAVKDPVTGTVRNPIQRVATVLAIACAALLVASCASSGAGNAGAQPADGKITVPLGVSLALSGQYASVGSSFQEGVNAAVADFPYQHITPQLDIQDNRLENPLAVQVFTQFASKDIPVVLGGFAGPSIAVGPVADRTQTVYINPLAPSDKLAGFEYLFNTLPMTSEEMRVTAKAIYDAGYRRIGVFFAPDIDGGGATDVLADAFTRLGGTVVDRQSVNATAADFASQVAKLKDANPDAVFGFAAYSVFGVVAKQLREAGVSAPLWSYRGFGEPSVFDVAGDAVEATRYTTPSSSLEGSPEAAAATQRYRDAHGGQAPGSFFTSMYDATWVALAALDRAAGEKGAVPTGEDVKKLFDTTTFAAPYSGDTEFVNAGPERGTVKKPFDLMEVQGRQFVKVTTLAPST